MKYTRNRQMGKSTKWKVWKGQKNLKMSEMTKRTKELDPTFKWHRECYPWGHNYVEFKKEVPVPPGMIEKRAILRSAK